MQMFRVVRKSWNLPALARVASVSIAMAIGLFMIGGTASAADVNAALAKVIDGAKAEGRLRLSWSDETLGGIAGAQEIQTELNKMFGTKIEIQFAPSSLSMGQMGNQIAAEHRSGRKARIDVFLASSSAAGRMAQLGLFKTVDWAALMPARITPKMSEADGRFLRFITYVAGVTYNTKLLPNPPRTLEAFLAPEFKGKLASTASASAFDILASSDFWGPEKAITYAKSLSGQISGLMRCSEGERVASGEFVAFLFDCGGSTAARLAAKGAPLAQLIPQEFVQLRYFYLGVPENAAQPNSGLLFAVFMMTEAGQKIAWKHWFSDLHMFVESETAKQMTQSQIDLAQAKDIGIEWLGKHPEGDKAKAEIVKILRQR